MFAVISYISSIPHKIFITGYRQNTCDHMHAIIEKQEKRVLKGGTIYVPAQGVTVIQFAKKTESPYEINEMDTADMYYLKQLCTSFGLKFSINENGKRYREMKYKKLKLIRKNPNDTASSMFIAENEEDNQGLVNLLLRTVRPQESVLQGKRDLLLLCEAKHL
ncbi:hypothetical protein PR048_029801, partial [Dryococelus australis]